MASAKLNKAPTCNCICTGTGLPAGTRIPSPENNTGSLKNRLLSDVGLKTNFCSALTVTLVSTAAKERLILINISLGSA